MPIASQVWSDGKDVGSLAFLGPLAGSAMADGGSVLIHLADGVDLGA